MGLFGVVLCLLSLHGGHAMVVLLVNNLYISRTIQLNSTAVTTFELYIDEEVDNNNKLYKWYERSMGRMVHGTNGLTCMVRIVRGTNSPDTTRSTDFYLRYQTQLIFRRLIWPLISLGRLYRLKYI